MTDAAVLDLARNAVMMALALAAPMLIVALGVGLAISVFQSVTQIQDQTLSFVPKLLAVTAVFLVGLPWMIQTAVKYTAEMLRALPSLVS
jgi:flagellar biosynthetic protein FliQ